MSGKRALIRGTAILTITSFVTRFMGFFYRIFLGHTFGEENVGLYQLVFPVYALGISFSCAGTELALSRCVCTGKCCRPSGKSKRIIKNRPDIYICSFLYSDHFFTAQCTYDRHLFSPWFQMRRTADFIVLYVSFCFNPQLHLRLFAWLKQTKFLLFPNFLNRHSVFYSCFFSVITAPAISWIFPSLLPLLVLLWGRSLHLAIACTLYTTQLRNKCRICFLQVLSASIFPGFSDTPFLLLPAGYYWTFCKV